MLRMGVVLGIVFGVFAIAARLLPHVPNFAPVGALALWAGMYMPKKYSFAGLFAVVLASDILIGFYELKIMAVVYVSYALIILMGQFLKKQEVPLAPLLGTLGSAILFYVTTNFAVWAFGTYYPHTWAGIVECYLMAVPFFRTTLQSDIVYGVVFFGVYEVALAGWARKKALVPVRA